MSIDDFRAVNEAAITTDLCLVGSGPAAWVIAEELRDSGLRVLMVESGGHAIDQRNAALNDTEDVGVPLFNGRIRALGGASRVWGGRCMPFDDIDFDARPWVPRSGWPFDAKAMARYVDRASEHLGSGPYYDGLDRRPLPKGLRPRPKVNPSLLHPTWWEKPPAPDFGRILAARRGSNLRVLVNATVTHINTDPSGRRCESVEIADLTGKRSIVTARSVILCAGGIENARILLYSNRVIPTGVGNAYDVVGRYFMDHPRDFELIARVANKHADRFRNVFGPCRLDGARGRYEFSYGFTLSPERQRSERLLNTAAWPYEVCAHDDPCCAMWRLTRGPRHRWVRDAMLVATNPAWMLGAMHSRFFARQSVRHKVERIGFLVASEQIPNRDSRVQLSDRRDWLGLPISKTDWRIDPLEAKSQAALAQSIAAEFRRLRLPPIRIADWVRDSRYGDAQFVDGCHPSGTTRMADDPRYGVVDADCQVHGVDGLFVAGSSVFPSNSHANPTLMIAALAVRLSHHLKRRLSNVGVRTELGA